MLYFLCTLFYSCAIYFDTSSCLRSLLCIRFSSIKGYFSLAQVALFEPCVKFYMTHIKLLVCFVIPAAGLSERVLSVRILSPLSSLSLLISAPHIFIVQLV